MSRGAPSGSLSALLRAKQAVAAAGIDPTAELVRAPHSSNEVWFVGDKVLRVAADSRGGRLALEKTIADRLPREVPHAKVVAHGKAALGEWLVMERVPGRPLTEAWVDMSSDVRREAVRQLAVALRGLHAVTPSVELLAYAHAETPHPLPATRVLEMLREAAALPRVSPSVLHAVEEVVLRVGPSLEPSEVRRGLVHGDLVFDNILWDGARITALLDLEWVRPGPPDLDLDVLLQYCGAPELSTQAADPLAVTAADLAEVPAWLDEAYPELFSHPRLQDRLTLFRLAFDVCALLKDPPTEQIDAQPYHPYNRLRRAVLAS